MTASLKCVPSTRTATVARWRHRAGVDLRGAAARACSTRSLSRRSTAATATRSRIWCAHIVDRHQRSAESGERLAGSRTRTDVTDRLVRSVVGAGPFEKFFVNPDLADEVSFKRDVITYFTRDGRQVIDSEPTSEAELTAVCQRLLADAGVAVDLENPVVVHQVWGNRVRASVSIPPVVGLSRRHLPHLPAAPHRPRSTSSSSARSPGRRPTSSPPSNSHRRACSSPADPGAASRPSPSALLRATPGHDDHPDRAGGPRARRAAPARRSLVARGRRPHDPIARASLAPVRSAAAGRRRDPRRGGVRAAQGRQRGMRVPHNAARQLGSARHAVAGDGRADGWRERPRTSRASDVRPAHRPRHPLRGRTAAPRRRPTAAVAAR